jgi:hypothetical protein
MWSIFIAIFGGLYWAIKIGSDRSKSRIADERISRRMAVQDRWREQVYDYNIETRLCVYPGDKDFQRKCDSAISFIRTLPGLVDANFDFRSRKQSPYYVSRMILLIQMVRFGKLPSECVSELGNYLELSLDTRPSKAARIAFGKWVELYLQTHGVAHANLYYTHKNNASFVWEPFVKDFDTATHISDPDLESQMIG